MCVRIFRLICKQYGGAHFFYCGCSISQYNGTMLYGHPGHISRAARSCAPQCSTAAARAHAPQICPAAKLIPTKQDRAGSGEIIISLVALGQRPAIKMTINTHHCALAFWVQPGANCFSADAIFINLQQHSINLSETLDHRSVCMMFQFAQIS